ncbi:MAG: hypothetical protein AB7V32_08080, partial [Candidatus Berkiella sp.]
MGSNNLRTLVRAAVVLGTFGFAAMGLVYVIPAIYSAITSLSFYNTLLFYFGVGTVLGALTAIPIFIPRVRNTLFSTITELLSRFTWQSQDVLDSALVHKRFVNKSPLGKVQELNILLKDDGYYEIVVKARNGDLLRSLRTSSSSIKNYLESDSYNTFSIKTSNMDVINFFLGSLANEDKHVEVLYKKYRRDFLDLGLVDGQFNNHFYLPSQIVEYQFKKVSYGHGLMSVIKVTNTRSDNRDFKKFEVTLEPQGGICLSVETNSDSFRSALNQIGNFSRIPFYAKEFMVEMTVDQFCNFCKECKIEGYITRTTCKELKRFAKDNAIVDQQSYDFKQDDAEDHSAMEEDLSLLSNQELLEHINNNRKAKGEAQISESSLPEHFMCTIGATLMDDPVHDGI